MWLFGLCAALLIAAALFFVLAPIIRPGQPPALRLLEQSLAAGLLNPDEYVSKRQQLLSSQPQATAPPKSFAVLLLLVIPAATLLLYYQLGSPQAIDPNIRAPITATPQGVQSMRDILENHPDDLQGWLILANTLVEQQRYSDAIPAFQRALELIPETQPERAVVLADVAEAIIFAGNSQQIPDQAREYLQQAIAIDPQLQRGLWLLGVVAFQDQNYALAIERWEQLMPLLENPAVSQSVSEQIAQAQDRLSGFTPALTNERANGRANDGPNNAAGGPAVTVQVSLSDALAAQLDQQPNTPVLFVFARVSGSQQPPVAIQRLAAAGLPLSVTLTEADAMLPGNSLATLPADTELELTARLSFSGNAIAQPGDWQGLTVTTINSDDDPLILTIDSIVPGS